MATTKALTTNERRYPSATAVDKEAVYPKSFDVTAVIGTVVFDEDSEQSPRLAAFQLIAEHDAPGTYSFPAPDGGFVSVTVEQ